MSDFRREALELEKELREKRNKMVLLSELAYLEEVIEHIDERGVDGLCLSVSMKWKDERGYYEFVDDYFHNPFVFKGEDGKEILAEVRASLKDRLRKEAF